MAGDSKRPQAARSEAQASEGGPLHGMARRERDKRIRELAAAYASRLEHHLLRAPYQWFNFYDVWAEGEQPEAARSEPEASEAWAPAKGER